MADLAIIMTLKEEELEIDTEISLGNAIPPAYGSIPHPETLFRLRWDGPVVQGIDQNWTSMIQGRKATLAVWYKRPV